MENNPVRSRPFLYEDDLPMISPNMDLFETPSDNDDFLKKFLSAAKSGGLDTEEKMKGFVERLQKTVDGTENIRHVVGLEELQQSIINAIVAPQRVKIHPDLTVQAILVAGPPGCAKTTILLQAAVLSARHLKKPITYFQVSYSDALHSYVGESEKFIKILYETAQKHQPAIILLDEAEGLMRKRNEKDPDHTSRFKSALLTQIQGYSDNSGVVLIATTNLPQDIDKGYQRRFQERFLIRLPTVEQRILIFDHFVRLCEHTGPVSWESFDFKKLAARSKRYSGDDIRNCVARALREKFVKNFTNQSSARQQAFDMTDLVNALKKSKPSCDIKDIRKLEKWGREMATHNKFENNRKLKSKKSKISKALICVFMGCFCGNACGA